MINLLLSFRDLITADPSHNLANWSISTSAAKSETLNLSDMGLSGTLSPHLGNLFVLASIDISFNYFQVKELNFGYNNFSGEIPPWLPNLPQLQHLLLQNNSFTGISPGSVNNNVSKLEILDISYNSMHGIIPPIIGNFSQLKSLNLSYNQLSGSLPISIFGLLSLIWINLGSNSLNGSLPESMCNDLAKLQSLRLCENGLYGSIPSSPHKCRELQDLSLYQNQLSGTIPREIRNLTVLRTLDIGDNNFQDMLQVNLISALHAAGAIPREIGSLAHLDVLSLRTSSLTGSVLRTIFNLSSLKAINFAFIASRQPSDIQAYGNADACDSCCCVNNLPSGISKNIGKLTLLKYLSVGENKFTGALPEELGKLGNLVRLQMGTASLSHLPSSFGLFLPHLEELHPGSKRLGEIIPNSIGNATKLTIVTLFTFIHRLRTETIASFGILSTSLRVLQGFGSKLKEDFPVGIGNLTGLELRSLDSNEFMGFIPPTIGRLQRLERLYLEHNQLHGYIPSDLCQLTNLGDLYLSDNKCYGPIPECLGTIKSLRALYIDSNNLTSTIPSSLWSLKDLLGAQALAYLSLSHKHLQGSFPAIVGNLISLEFLDMSINNLSGEIPKSLEKLKYLQYFNVSFNKLQGSIPTGGNFVYFTTQSFMQNDGLCGAARLQVPQCKPKALEKSRTKTRHILKCGKRNMQLPSLADSFPLASRPRFSYQELEIATNAFRTLQDGTSVAIKVFNLQIEGAFKSFDAECEVTYNIRHRNLVKIISSCSNLDFKALLYIMIDVALATEYLHHHHPAPIIHCDLKPSNILLDENMMARENSWHKPQPRDMAPEHGMRGIVSTGGDIYSFGVILMEVFTRKGPTGEIFVRAMSLKSWISESLQGGSIIEVIDGNLIQKEEANFHAKEFCVPSLMSLAMDCKNDLPDERINRADVVTRLRKIQLLLLEKLTLLEGKKVKFI
ncbi:Non-specific serine/threonine protein kinase [Bertholletia excelsa]